MNAAPQAAGGERKRRLVLTERIEETPLIASFFLADPSGAPLWPFLAGQHVVLEIPGRDGRPKPRPYTISSAPGDLARYRLTVKREAAPPGREDLPPGLASTHLHDALPPGGEIVVHRPRGEFLLREGDRPIVLLSGGVGLTPMVSMLASLVETSDPRPVSYVHACLDSRSEALRAEVAALCAAHGRARRHVFHERPLDGDRQGRDYDAAGRITPAALEALLPGPAVDAYLCGPTGFMQAIYAALTAYGVDPARIAYESFGPATVLQPAAPPGP
jgi:ferredoxin-NADP reductase